jgi:hypothetical protein
MFPIAIPTTNQFLHQWYLWTNKEVAKQFKRNRSRLDDVVQLVRVRLLSKEFIERWFFKYVAPVEYVDRIGAEKILGDSTLKFNSLVKPFSGNRSDPNSIWEISELLRYAKFDAYRYFYTPQSHTLDTRKILRLLGCGPEDFGVLQSLYRQGRLLPSEMTEHICTNSLDCIGCEEGKISLYRKNLSLAHNWNDSSLQKAVLKLRWNDEQLVPFLRDWKGKNRLKGIPNYVMRTINKSLDQSYLGFARIIIENTVKNEFKHIHHHDEIGSKIYNNGVSISEFSNSEVLAFDDFDSDDSSQDKEMIARDPNSIVAFDKSIDKCDLSMSINNSGITEEEEKALIATELMETPIRVYAESCGVSSARIAKLRESAIRKLKDSKFGDNLIKNLAVRTCAKYGCSLNDLFNKSLMFGPVTKARSDFFLSMVQKGYSTHQISKKFKFPEERVKLSIDRASIRSGVIV